LKTKFAKNTFIQIFFHHLRLAAVLLKNAYGADPNTTPALSNTSAGGHIHIHNNELDR
jgi:hypothetical protein